MILWGLFVLKWGRCIGATTGGLAAIATGIVAWRLRRRPVLLAGVLGGGLITVQVALTCLGLAEKKIYPTAASYGGKVRSLGNRLDYWNTSVMLFLDHPLTGVGPGQFRRHHSIVKSLHTIEETSHPHNWLLGMAAEWGILGVLGVVTAVCRRPAGRSYGHWATPRKRCPGRGHRYCLCAAW